MSAHSPNTFLLGPQKLTGALLYMLPLRPFQISSFEGFVRAAGLSVSVMNLLLSTWVMMLTLAASGKEYPVDHMDCRGILDRSRRWSL
uniref:Uncharacterized protein n=1 Tax=Moniliophthora roreri TaxID=221103 RepID=A0A0W0F4Q5_MONRR